MLHCRELAALHCRTIGGRRNWGVPYKIARHYVHEVAESLLEPASGGAHDVS